METKKHHEELDDFHIQKQRVCFLRITQVFVVGFSCSKVGSCGVLMLVSSLELEDFFQRFDNKNAYTLELPPTQ